MSHLDKQPLTHVDLLPGEEHLYSAVLVRVTPMKMFGFAGPKAYQVSPLAPRYRAHITDRRLLLEIYQYSKKEVTGTKWAIRGVSMLMGQFADTQMHAQIALQRMAYGAAMKENLAAASDPEAQCIAIPYDILTVTVVSSMKIGYFVKLETSADEGEVVFQAQLDTEGRLLPKGSIVDNTKVTYGLSRQFVKLCQEAIAEYRSRMT